jgi:hypothetical protein
MSAIVDGNLLPAAHNIPDLDKPFLDEEFLTALEKMKLGEAPGVDGISIEALKLLKSPEVRVAFLETYNGNA